MSNNVKVGFITVLGLLVFILVMTWKSVSMVEVQGYDLVGEFGNISGLLEMSDVQYRGFKVGKVIKIVPRPENIHVYMKISNKLKIPADSKFIVAFDGLIGQKYIAIAPGTYNGVFAKPGDILYGQSTHGIVDFVAAGTDALAEAKMLLASLRRITDDKVMRTTILDTLSNINKLSSDLGQLGPKLENVATGLEQIVSGISPVFQGEATAEHIKALLQNMDEASNDLKDMTKSVRKITDDPETEQNIRELIKNLKEISHELKGSFSGGSSSKDTSLKDIAKMAKTMSNVRAGADADVLYSGALHRGTVRAGAKVAFNPDQYYEARAGEIAAGQGAVLDIVQGNRVTDDFSWRWGIIQTGLGVGAQYTIWDRLTFLGDVYGPDTLKTSAGAQWKINNQWAVKAMAERMGERADNYYIGINVKP